ncbi:hypothetical protein TRAPUB_13595 [Trametes pubescens]|uniref:Uncharacterized protein n=1 Tax=Trametes pubescens TaxID=154538 RepID=A0A1M2VQT8_TRAPU|nr:hypothetical protein TRAPUB_13595 [Trametes pubescens]
MVTAYDPDGPASRFGGSFKAGQPGNHAGAVFGASPFFQSEATFLLTGFPDPSSCRGLHFGDVFLHTATRFSPPKYQLWLWTTDGDGCAIWNPVAVGHTRDDGKRLTLSPETKSLSWVTDKHFQHVLRLEQGTSSPAIDSTITGNDGELSVSSDHLSIALIFITVKWA